MRDTNDYDKSVNSVDASHLRPSVCDQRVRSSFGVSQEVQTSTQGASFPLLPLAE
jgi:hypothetical protein